MASIFLIAGVLFGTLTTAIVRYAALRLGIVSRPNPIVAQHTHPVAYLGGLGVALGVLGSLALSYLGQEFVGNAVPDAIALRLGSPPTPTILLSAILVGAGLFLLLGLVDDLQVLSPVSKFALQAGVAAIAVRSGVVAPLIGSPVVDAVLSALWILTLVNAMNFTDVCDGLVGGLTVIAFTFLGALVPEAGGLCFAVAGSCLGFLVFNRPPALIFLGDAGSHLLGFLLAAMTLLGVARHPTVAMGGGMLLIIGVPLFEAVFITAVRIRKGLPWWRGSPDHFALRLQARGMSRWEVDLLAWSVGAVLGATAVGFQRIGPVGQAGTLLAALALASCCAHRLLKWEVEGASMVWRTPVEENL